MWGGGDRLRPGGVGHRGGIGGRGTGIREWRGKLALRRKDPVGRHRAGMAAIAGSSTGLCYKEMYITVIYTFV